MTVTASVPRPVAFRYWWVPSGVPVGRSGIIATLSLIAERLAGIRWLIKEPRKFVNDYVSTSPTPLRRGPSLALLAAAPCARKRIAMWIWSAT